MSETYFLLLFFLMSFLLWKPLRWKNQPKISFQTHARKIVFCWFFFFTRSFVLYQLLFFSGFVRRLAIRISNSKNWTTCFKVSSTPTAAHGMWCCGPTAFFQDALLKLGFILMLLSRTMETCKMLLVCTLPVDPLQRHNMLYWTQDGPALGWYRQ